MLRLLDIFLTALHLGIIGFNLLGWIWPRTRPWHLLLVLLTAGSWMILGIWHGFGYCPVTDWQWEVKEQLGARNLPHSYITWLIGTLSDRRFSNGLIDAATGISFATAAALSIVLNIRQWIRRKKPETA